MTTTMTATSTPSNTLPIDTTISSVKAAIDAAHAARKAQTRELVIGILGGHRELPTNVADLELVLAELCELRIVTEYAELKALTETSPSRLAKLTAEWISCQAKLEKTQAEYFAAASESRLPHHENWDASAAQFEQLVDDARAALHASHDACSQELTRVADAKVHCKALLRDYGHLFVDEAA